MSESKHVISLSMARMLNNPVRTMLQRPKKIVSDYVSPGARVLDIGSGPGFFSLPMAELVGEEGEVWAVDIRSELLEQVERSARKKGLLPRIRTHRCLANRLDLPSDCGQFDFVLLYFVLHECPHPRATLEEIGDVLKPSGPILLVEPRFHVKKEAFEASLDLARSLGYGVEGRGRGNLSMFARLRRH